ncbi:SDR family NAD(P)-dependent oxidoreductase [Streptomyces sp. NPDC019531]|uniref:SDR family NAD(P)-dependent oxidoreductase n=1 Tax=Streptomyces sp. NPDC019531 TaxID=3365062 RepID=UPI00384DB94D
MTGGTRGIGREVVRQPADAGALVCILARRTSGGPPPRSAASGSRAPAQCSVTDPEHLRTVVDLAPREFGRLDIVVNDAATNQPNGPLMDVAPQAWREAFTVNVEATLRLVQESWRRWMREHGGSGSTSARRAPHMSVRTSARTAPVKCRCCISPGSRRASRLPGCG